MNDSTAPVRPFVAPGDSARMSVAPWIITLVVIALAASGGYWFFQENQMVREALANAETEAARARRLAAQADGRVMEVEAELSRVRGDFSADRRQVRKTREALAGMLGEVLAENKRGKLAEAGDGLRVELVADSLFRAGQPALSEDGRILLQNLAGVLVRFPDVDVWVRSSASRAARTAGEPDAWQRSSARALAVSRFLEQEFVDPARLAVITHAAGAGSAADAARWRVEIVLGARAR